MYVLLQGQKKGRSRSGSGQRALLPPPRSHTRAPCFSAPRAGWSHTRLAVRPNATAPWLGGRGLAPAVLLSRGATLEIFSSPASRRSGHASFLFTSSTGRALRCVNLRFMLATESRERLTLPPLSYPVDSLVPGHGVCARVPSSSPPALQTGDIARPHLSPCPFRPFPSCPASLPTPQLSSPGTAT